MSLNIVDKVVAFFDPAAGIRRSRARAALAPVKASYDGAKTGRRTAGWTTTGTSANAETHAALASLRDRSRDLIRNNPLAGNAQEKWTASVVGAGIVCQWENATLQAKWDQWIKKCSADGLPGFEAIQSQVCDAEFESGEVLVRARMRRRSDGVWPPIQLQVLEPDYLDLSRSGVVDGGYIIQGVEFNGVGKRVAYWLFEQHPGDNSVTGLRGSVSSMSKRVPASEITHVGRPKRPGQVRVAPRLAPATLPAKDTADWEEAEIVRKRTEACIAAAVTSPEGDEFQFTTEVVDANGNPVSTFEPGMMLKLKPGEEITFNTPGHAGGYDEYKVSRQREFAAGVQMPFELLTGNYSNSNYSSSRMGAVAFKRSVEAHQWIWFIPQFCEWAAQKFLEYLAMFDGPVPDMAHTWSPPAFELLDRLSESKADQVDLQIGKKSWPQVVAGSGNNPDQQIAEIEKYAERLGEAGIDFFNGQLAIADQNAADPQQVPNEPQ
jgi:lambda family phage portal protein